jgi:hypothetical protein
MELGGASAGVGLRLASAAFQPLIKRLFGQGGGPGAGLVDKPVRVSSLVSFRGEKRTLVERDLRRLSEEVVRRAVRGIGPHDALSEDELVEVADELSRALIGLGELDMDDVQAVRLGPERLAGRLASATATSTHPAYDLYRLLLERCCLHILNFFTQRSTFVARTLVEQSRQLDQLAARIDLLIERVPPRSAEDAAFEQRYAAYIEQEHSQLTIYGLDLNQEREWPLDDAYLSLEARGREELEDSNAAPQRAERALAGKERVLLRGLAGSGKTTLVQWLAIATARQDANADDGMTHLLGRVPFVLPMRTLTRDGGPLPTPDRFLAAVNNPLAAAQPDGWIDRLLSARRGLLLVDGIDEIPEAEREDARRWLRRLNATYPGNLWLVTARPAAVREDWLGREDFTDLTLAPMGSRDMQAFVHRWHRAADVRDPEVENALLDLVRSRTDLATLATNPLMCAMICALHRERNGHLPHGRKALYDAALAMLLERRDRERPDRPRVGGELDADTQISLLQKLAYWLINNGRSEMTHDVAAALIGQALPYIHRGGKLGTGDEVLRHLIERSGVLREPASGAVDFVHRTFQDYLGAREIVEWQHFPALIEKAHEDQWEDVVRMAVAHAQPPQRAELLTALMERGEREPEYRVRLHLLAMACLEQATQLRPDVRDRVETAAAAFIPPRNYDEAWSLARAGAVVLELLPGPDGLSDNEVGAVVRTAMLLASDAALTKLRAFRAHPSRDARARLTTGWSRFDTTRYFDEIVSRLPRHDLVLHTTTPEELRLVATLDGLSRVSLRGEFSEEDILAALEAHPVTELHLRDNSRLEDLRFLGRFRELSALLLDGCPGTTNLSSLGDVPISELSVFSGDGGLRVADVHGLDALTTLRALTIGSPDPSSLPWRAPLERLTLPEVPPPLTGIGAWPGLTRLALHHCARGLDGDEWETIADLPHLRQLLLNSTTLNSLGRLGVCLPRVSFAQFFSDDLSSVPPDEIEHLADALPGLRTLVLNRRFTYSTPLARLRDLREVQVLAPGPHPDGPTHYEVISPPAPRY